MILMMMLMDEVDDDVSSKAGYDQHLNTFTLPENPPVEVRMAGRWAVS